MRSKIFPAIILTFLTGALACSGCASAALNPILIEQETLHKADVIVVLGYGPPVDENGKPKPELARRVEKGVELYNQGLAENIIMTGGNTYEDYFEAKVMRDVATQMGVPEKDIYLELEAMDTIGNSRGSTRIMKEHGWKSAIIVSSPYHLKRALHLFSANEGIEFQTAGCDTPDNPAYGMVFTLYECLARLTYLPIDERERARADWTEKNDR